MVAIFRAALVIVACVAAGLAGWWASGLMDATVGGPAAAMHLAQRPLPAMAALVGALVVFAATGWAISRLVGPGSAMLAVGAGVFTFASNSGTFLDAIRQEVSFGWLMIEDLIWSLALAAVVTPIIRTAPEHSWLARPAGAKAGFARRLLAIFIATAAMIPMVWLISRSELKGQVIAAATVGSIVAAIAVRLVADAPRTMAYAVPMLGAAVGHWIAGSFATLSPATIGEGLSPLALPMPQDAAAGALFGTTLGLMWAASLIEPSPAPGAAVI